MSMSQSLRAAPARSSPSAGSARPPASRARAVRFVRAYRVELAFAAAPLLLWLWLQAWLPMLAHLALMTIEGAVLGVVVAVPAVRGWLLRVAEGARLRRE